MAAGMLIDTFACVCSYICRSNDIQNIVLYMYSAFNAYIVKKARESLVSDIPVGDWKIANLFYRFYRFFYRFDLCLLYFWFNTIHKHSVILHPLMSTVRMPHQALQRVNFKFLVQVARLNI
jgi:hypothetical protein